MTKYLFTTQPNSQSSFKGWIYWTKHSEHTHGKRILIWTGSRESLDRNENSNKESIGDDPKRSSVQSDDDAIDQWVYPLDRSGKNSIDMERNSQPTKSFSFEGSSPKKNSRTSSLPNVLCSSTSKQRSIRPVQASIFIYLISLFGHFVSFFIKGGISAMVFISELILHFFMHVLEILNIPGSSTLGATVKAVLFLSTTLIWVLYWAVELMFVLPVKLQLFYIALLTCLWYYSPLYLKDFIKYLLWAALRFFRFFKSFII